MSRNKKKIRMQDFPSRQELDDYEANEVPFKYKDDAESVDKGALRPKTPYKAPKSNLKDGEVTNMGTVINVVGDKVFCLQEDGLIVEYSYWEVVKL